MMVLLFAPNATPHPHRGAVQSYTCHTRTALPGVGCRRLILIEAPSSAYHCGMLSLENNHSHEEETSCASTPSNTHFTVASTCMPGPCTPVSSTSTVRSGSIGTCQLGRKRFSRPSRPIEMILSSP